jgi:glycine/D-amino acid oxidase-like deaminating enzyme
MSRTHVISGGGFYGCYVAWKIANRFPQDEIIILEREDGLCSKATYNNQARIHNGYHYPRSVLTGLRSRINYPRFKSEFAECVSENFTKVYAIERNRSNVTASQFEHFCERIGADIAPASEEIHSLFNPALIEGVFVVDECAFDAVKLRDLMLGRLTSVGVKVRKGREAIKISEAGSGELSIDIKNNREGSVSKQKASYFYNCTYSNLNDVLSESGLSLLDLKLEATEIAIVDVPDAVKSLGITVMCGPFFSVMPFPNQKRHSFSHVSYTPHYEWSDGKGKHKKHTPEYPLPSAFDRMRRDASRYVPILSECEYLSSLWETKTVLPRSEADDSRPILFSRDPKLSGVISILGGKIDNVFDIDEALDEVFAEEMV